MVVAVSKVVTGADQEWVPVVKIVRFPKGTVFGTCLLTLGEQIATDSLATRQDPRKLHQSQSGDEKECLVTS